MPPSTLQLANSGPTALTSLLLRRGRGPLALEGCALFLVVLSHGSSWLPPLLLPVFLR